MKIPNKDYRFKRMMEQVVLACAPPARGHNVGIVCLPGEERALYHKIIKHVDTGPRPMSLGAPDYHGNHHGLPCLIYTDTESSISILCEPEDFNGRTFESIYTVCDAKKFTGASIHCLGTAVLRAKVAVNLNNPDTYNWE